MIGALELNLLIIVHPPVTTTVLPTRCPARKRAGPWLWEAGLGERARERERERERNPLVFGFFYTEHHAAFVHFIR